MMGSCWIYGLIWVLMNSAIAEGHYCFYCATFADSTTQLQLVNQRVFVYPSTAVIQTQCKMPSLLDVGHAYICDKPLCVTVTPSQPSGTGDFTILGCAEQVLRPAMLSRIPLEAYTNRGPPVCIELENRDMAFRQKFTVCFCNKNLCNNGENSNSTTSTKSMIAVPTAPSDVKSIDIDFPVDGSGESSTEIKQTIGIESNEQLMVTGNFMPTDARDPAAIPTVIPDQSIKPGSIDTGQLKIDAHIEDTSKTTSGNVRDHRLNGDYSNGHTKSDQSVRSISETRRQQHTRDLNAGYRHCSGHFWVVILILGLCGI